MIERDELILALRRALPSEEQETLETIADLVASAQATNGGASRLTGSTAKTSSVAQALRNLSGKHLHTTSATVSFGEENQFGDVTIRDIITGGVNNVTINVPPPREESGGPDRGGQVLAVALSALAVVIILFAVFRESPGTTPTPRPTVEEPTLTPPAAPTTIAPDTGPTTAVVIDGFTWTSSFSTLNIGLGTADVTVDGYNSNGVPVPTEIQIAPGEAYTIDASQMNMPPGLYSAVASSSQPIVIVAFMNGSKVGDPSTKVRFSYQAVNASETDSNVFFPMIKNDYGGFTSRLNIQNSGYTATTITVTFTMLDGSTYTYRSPTAIAPGASLAITPADAKVPTTPNDPNLQRGSAVAESGEPNVALAGVSSEEDTDRPNDYTGLLRALTAADAITKAYVPIRDTDNKTISFYVFNAESQPISAQITYGTLKDEASGCMGENIYSGSLDGILPGTSSIFTQEQLPQEEGTCVKWAIIESDGRFVAFANETSKSNREPSSMSYLAKSYASLAKRIAVPHFLDSYDGLNSRFQVRNMSASPATIIGRFRCTRPDKTTFVAETNPILIKEQSFFEFFKPSQSADLFPADQPFTSGARCSVMVEGDQLLLGYVTESFDDTRNKSWVNADAFPIP